LTARLHKIDPIPDPPSLRLYDLIGNALLQGALSLWHDLLLAVHAVATSVPATVWSLPGAAASRNTAWSVRRAAFPAQVAWDNVLREPGWMAVGNSLEVVADHRDHPARQAADGHRRYQY
jgi:hypothetical protein